MRPKPPLGLEQDWRVEEIGPTSRLALLIYPFFLIADRLGPPLWGALWGEQLKDFFWIFQVWGQGQASSLQQAQHLHPWRTKWGNVWGTENAVMTLSWIHSGRNASLLPSMLSIKWGRTHVLIWMWLCLPWSFWPTRCLWCRVIHPGERLSHSWGRRWSIALHCFITDTGTASMLYSQM